MMSGREPLSKEELLHDVHVVVFGKSFDRILYAFLFFASFWIIGYFLVVQTLRVLVFMTRSVAEFTRDILELVSL